MESKATRAFWRRFHALPEDVQRQAIRAYRLWREDHYHPSLHFRRISQNNPLYSVRVGIHYRAVGVRDDDVITWFWIGSHADYDGLLQRYN